MKLSAQEIARYRPPHGKVDHIVFDDELSGFGLRYRNGRKTWIYQYAFGSGEGRVNARMTLGENPALSPARRGTRQKTSTPRFGSGSTRRLPKRQAERNTATPSGGWLPAISNFKRLRYGPIPTS
jgi:hypothetical protein